MGARGLTTKHAISFCVWLAIAGSLSGCACAGEGMTRPADAGRLRADASTADDAAVEGTLDGAPGSPDAGSSGERCNGRDDDGDGRVDEDCNCMVGDVQPCYPGDPAHAGVGTCLLGRQTCLESGVEFGTWGPCLGAEPPDDEVCDERDNDCDGVVDDGCECVPGEVRSCYGGPEGTQDVGACRAGEQRCVEAPGGVGTRWAEACEGQTIPASEVCNGVDDDCDGASDEDCECRPSETRACWTGPPESRNVGICRDGMQTCSASGAWGACTGATLPATEVCNGIDDDCDSVADEGCSCRPRATRSCYPGPAGTEGIGICRAGTQTCELSPDGTSSAWGSCIGAVLPAGETCNGADDDCDGMLDETCACRSGEVRACYSGPPSTRGVGACRDGTQTCSISGGTAIWGPCTGERLPSSETCDGVDQDCDGVVDDGACPRPPSVTCPPPATTRPLVPVTLVGSASDPDGAIVSWSWTLESAPAGASGTFSAPTSPTTQFTPNLVGVYTVRLTVRDDSGLVASCTTTVTARGDGIRVEVTWDTSGTDVDTHLLRMAGGTPWFDIPNDCFYLNRTPSWDAPGTADDPRLDIDDVDGYGPENINVDVPVTGSTYRVGIHYYRGSVPSRVTVRIYCGDISVTPVRTYMRTLSVGSAGSSANDFWRVADVRWDGGDACTVTTIDTMTTGAGAMSAP